MNLFKEASLLFAISLALASCGGNVGTSRLASESRASEKDARAFYNAGIAAQKAGKLGRARKYYQRIVLRHPLCPTAADSAYRWGKLLEKDGQPLEAFEAYDAILTKYPNSPNYAEAMSRQNIIAHQVANGHIQNSFVGIKSRVDLKRSAEMLSKVRQNAPRTEAAEKAQYTIGQLYQTRGKGFLGITRAIKAFEELTRDYPDSKYAAEAQYRIGEILLDESNDGNQDSANLERAKRAFEDVIIRYPNTQQAKKAKAQVAKLTSGDIQKSFDIAEFYEKKGQISSALFYYREAVSRSKPGPLRTRAQARIKQLTAQ